MDIPALSPTTIDPAQAQATLQRLGNLSPEAQQAEAARQFEAMFLRQYLADALKPMIEGALNESGASNEMTRHLFTDMMADSLSQHGNFGIANALQAQLSSQPRPVETQPNA